VTDDHRSVFPYRIEQADEIANEVQQRVRANARRSVGLPIAPLIGRYYVIAGIRQKPYLVPP
jgi:hypothetical protein